MTAEQHLLDVIYDIPIGGRTADRILAALREAIAEDIRLSDALLPNTWIATHGGTLSDLVRLGRAVEATTPKDDSVRRYSRWQSGWNGCLDAIYTAADVERQP